MAKILGAAITADGHHCRINHADRNGRRGSLTFEADEIPQVMALLAQCAANVQAARQKQKSDIPSFPAQSMLVRQSLESERVLVTFRIHPGMDMTFQLDKPSLRRGLADISAFLEEGSAGSKSSQTH